MREDVNDPLARAFREHGEFFLFQPTIIDIDRYDGVLLLNEQGDLYILLHNIGVQIIPFKSRNIFQNLLEGKKDIAGNVHRAPYSGI